MKMRTMPLKSFRALGMFTWLLSRFTRTRGVAIPAPKRWALTPMPRRMSRTFASPTPAPSGKITTWVLPRL